MFQLIGLLGNVVFGVVDSNNKRDVEIIKDTNKSRIEISKVLLEGAALFGTLALSAYYHHTSNKPAQSQKVNQSYRSFLLVLLSISNKSKTTKVFTFNFYRSVWAIMPVPILFVSILERSNSYETR